MKSVNYTFVVEAAVIDIVNERRKRHLYRRKKKARETGYMGCKCI